MSGEETELVVQVRLSGNAMVRVESLRDEDGVKQITVMRSTAGSVL